MYSLCRKYRIYLNKWIWFLQPITSKVTSVYANKTFTLRTEQSSLVASVSLIWSRNSLRKRCYDLARYTLKINVVFKIKICAKNNLWWMYGEDRKSVNRDHCSASLGKPRHADPWPRMAIKGNYLPFLGLTAWFPVPAEVSTLDTYSQDKSTKYYYRTPWHA